MFYWPRYNISGLRVYDKRTCFCLKACSFVVANGPDMLSLGPIKIVVCIAPILKYKLLDSSKISLISLGIDNNNIINFDMDTLIKINTL